MAMAKERERVVVAVVTGFDSYHRRLPVVQIAKDAPDQPSVRADNVQGMTAVMSHVLDDCGARTPVLIRGLSHIADHVMREKIFRAEMARRGLRVDEDFILGGGSREEITKQEMRRLLRRRRDMDAVVTTDDWCALAAIDAIREVGLRVPQDVVVTGFDNYPMAAMNWPSLTTVDQNLDEQGATAARMVLDGLDGVVSREQVLTKCDLIVRICLQSATSRHSAA
jgi:DNA-binding LacI/PurR family transcriptional regulator